MAFTNINSEDRLVQATFSDYLCDNLGWESVYAFNTETFGPGGSLGRDSERDAGELLVRCVFCREGQELGSGQVLLFLLSS